MMENNFLLKTDSYKMSHHRMYVSGTEKIYSYLEARGGAEYPYTVFFGLQFLIKECLEGVVFSHRDIIQAENIAASHFGQGIFNSEGWWRLLEKHEGCLPIRIKAVPEGTIVPNSNVLMTIENTDPEFPWLTNYVESFLMHIWYPITVATRSRFVKELINDYLLVTSDNPDAVDFMLHDFGYRGTTSDEAAAIGGAAHLVNFKGTDTLLAMALAMQYYDAELESLAFSVPASEHSVMTSLGEDGEMEMVSRLLDEFPTGILSVVADSYNIYDFVNKISDGDLRDRITNRDGVFVVRPDSVTEDHPTPHELTISILWTLWECFGGEINSKGYRVLNPKIRVLWGDGIDTDGIKAILELARVNDFSAENLVFGMGGGLLQKLNRDTQRFAFKCSAQRRNGEWFDIQKDPLDQSKASKAGRFQLASGDGLYKTVNLGIPVTDILETVFENGELIREQSFEEIRAITESLVTNAV